MTAQLSINKHDEIVKEPHLNIKQFLYNSNSDYMNYYYNILNIVYSNKDLVINLINFYEKNYKNLLIDNDASQKLKIEELQKKLNKLKNENNNLKDKYNNLEKETCDIALNLDKDNDTEAYISELLGELSNICGMFEYLGEGDWLFRELIEKNMKIKN